MTAQSTLLGRYSNRVVVNFDPDRAGANAAKRSLETLLSEGFNVKVLSLPDNLDPDGFIRKQGPVVYYKHLKRSQPFLDFVVEQAVSTHGISTPAGQSRNDQRHLCRIEVGKGSDRARRTLCENCRSIED